MKSLLKLLLISTIFVSVYAKTVEEAWDKYKSNLSWRNEIPNFESFKAQWDAAKAYNSLYETTEDAYNHYKSTYFQANLPDSLEIFKPKYAAVIANNEKFLNGEAPFPKNYGGASYFNGIPQSYYSFD